MDYKPPKLLEAWRFYLKDCESPDSFIDASFYYLIAASLQRRVFLGSDEKPLFPNLYIVFVGPPAVGKGQVIVPLSDIFQYHKLKPTLSVMSPGQPSNTPASTEPKGEEDAASQLALLREFQASNPHLMHGGKGGVNVNPESLRPKAKLAIPMAANATSYEALVRAHSYSLRTIHVTSDSRLVKNGMYSHSSLAFCLDELSSLFRSKKASEDTSKYLLQAYDCRNYQYDAKTPGLADDVYSPCLNMLGGTQAPTLREMFGASIMNDGLSSRIIFIYEETPRFYRFDTFTYSAAQLAAKQQIIQHVGELLKLFGLVKYSPEAYEFMKTYVEKILPNKNLRPNNSPKLESYYDRKKLHVQKLAMAIHFAESTEMTIGVEAFQQAITYLGGIEAKMDQALNFSGRGSLASLAGKAISVLKKRQGLTFTQLWEAMIEDVSYPKDLQNCLEFLIGTEKVGMEVTNVGSQQQTRYYTK